jgi:hypothetical protein
MPGNSPEFGEGKPPSYPAPTACTEAKPARDANWQAIIIKPIFQAELLSQPALSIRSRENPEAPNHGGKPVDEVPPSAGTGC